MRGVRNLKRLVNLLVPVGLFGFLGAWLGEQPFMVDPGLVVLLFLAMGAYVGYENASAV